MLDLATVLEEQKNLDKLCAPRPFRSPERYWPNDNYGLSRVLKLYSGYPEDKSLNALVPHGLVYDDVVFQGEAQAPLPAVLSWPEYRDVAYARFSDKVVIPSAAPFLYVLSMLGHPATDTEREGTIFFPVHSTNAVEVDTDWYMLAKALERIDDAFKPVTVCIHWQDYERGRHKNFSKRGFPIVSAGHLFDLDFVLRLAHLFSTCRYAASNDVASNLFYAVAAGVPYFLLGETVAFRPSDRCPPAFASQMISRPNPERMDPVRALFREPVDETTPEQRECVSYFLGASRFKSPEDLRCDLQFTGRR